MAKIARDYPSRTPAEILTADATMPELPQSGLVVIFIFNPFNADLTAKLLRHLDAAKAERPELKLFLVSYNPTQANLIDAEPWLRRYSAQRLAFAPEEAGTSPFGNQHDSVVIWQSAGPREFAAKPDADRRVVVTIPNLGAEVDA